MRTLALLVALALPVAADDESPIRASAQKFELEAKLVLAKMRRAATPAEKTKLQDEYSALETKFLAEWVGLAAKDPTGPDSFDVFAQALAEDGDTGKLARRMIGEHHAGRPDVWTTAVALAMTGQPDAIPVLTKIVEKNRLDKNRGIATAALGLAHKKQATTGPAAAREQHLAEARKAFAAAAEKYPQVRISSAETVQQYAMAQLAGIENIAKLLPGATAPEIVGEDTDGKPMKLSDYRGKVILVDFWATWCPKCMSLVPHAKALAEKHAAAGFEVVGVNMDTDADDLKAEVARRGIGWRSFKNVVGDGPKIVDLWNVEKYPTFFLIDRKGVVRKVIPGSADPEVISAEVAKVVNEK